MPMLDMYRHLAGIAEPSRRYIRFCLVQNKSYFLVPSFAPAPPENFWSPSGRYRSPFAPLNPIHCKYKPLIMSSLGKHISTCCCLSRVPCTKVLSQEIQIFQETSFCVLQVLLRNFTNRLWQLYIDFYTIRMVFESSFQLCTFEVANLNKLWQFW